MSILIGQVLTGRDLTQKSGSWSAGRFSSLCDSLIWAEAGRSAATPPSFASEVNTPDGGVDTEWDFTLSSSDIPSTTPFLAAGWNVFQYKKRDPNARDLAQIVGSLKSGLKGALKEILSRHGKLPASYVLFTNVELTHQRKKSLRGAIMEGLPEQSVRVAVEDAAGLAALLNNQPHLKAAFLAPLPFKTWDAANEDRKSAFMGGLELEGREREMAEMRAMVDDPAVRVVLLNGPSGIGKSRLLLEATGHRRHQVVQALDPWSLNLEDYGALAGTRGETLCIVEDPDRRAIQPLINATLEKRNLKLLLAFPSRVEERSYGADARIKTMTLGRLSHDAASKLVRRASPATTYELEDWILSNADGNPGILLAAAAFGKDLKGKTGDFAANVGNAFNEKVRDGLGEEALKVLRILSVMSHMGIDGEAQEELSHACRILGEGATPSQVHRHLRTLEGAGMLKRTGSYVAVSIPVFSDHLLRQLLAAQSPALLFALFKDLSADGRYRLMSRLTQVREMAPVRSFLREFFTGDGPMGTLESALAQGDSFTLMAAAFPDLVVDFLESTLGALTLEQRKAINGDQRRNLMWALEQLLFRAKTGARTMDLLLLLAEAESEKWGNNAIGVLQECLQPLHPQLPIALSDRETFIKNALKAGQPSARKGTILKALKGALGSGSVTMRHSDGPDPLDGRPPMTWKDVGDYARLIIDEAARLAKAGGELSGEALSALESLLIPGFANALPAEAVKRLEEICAWSRSSPPFGLIARFRSHFRLSIENASQHGKDAMELNRLFKRVEKCERNALKGKGFQGLLHRWAGSRHYEDSEFRSGDLHDRAEEELKKLAHLALERPPILLKEIPWLLSPKAERAGTFFYILGGLDKEGHFLEELGKAGENPAGAFHFGSYFYSYAQNDPSAAAAWLRRHSPRLCGEAVVRAAMELPPAPDFLPLILAQLSQGRVTPARVADLLSIGRWAEGLSPSEFTLLLTAIVGTQTERPGFGVDLLGKWMFLQRPMDGELAGLGWSCLEKDPALDQGLREWSCDRLAAKLAEGNPERGFALLQHLIAHPDREVDEDKRWNPLNTYRNSAFWRVLRDKDPRRFFALILEPCRKDESASFMIPWRLRELIRAGTDKETLLSIAKEEATFARAIAGSLTPSQDGFWPLLDGLLQSHPDDRRLRSELAGALEGEGQVITGPISKFMESRLKQIEEKIGEGTLSSAARTFLRKALDEMRPRVSQQVVWEYDRDVNGLRRFADDKGASQHLWAVARILKYADWEHARKLLSVEDIEAGLPQADLPEEKKRDFSLKLEALSDDRPDPEISAR